MNKLFSRLYILFLAVFVLIMPNVNAQDKAEVGKKQVDHIVKVGAGGLLFVGNHPDGEGEVLAGVSYGADVWLDDKWSVMPGIGFWADSEVITGFNLGCGARYHFKASGGPGIIVGLGPELMILSDRGKYTYDADPKYGLNGKTKYRSCDIALHPSIVIESGKHWLWGLEGSIGINNMRLKYPEYNINGPTRFAYVMLTCGFRF